MNRLVEVSLDHLAKVSPMLVGSPVEELRIALAEGELGASFPADYREFVHRYGGLVLGDVQVVGLSPDNS